jgi:ABC-type cobalamin/Fe3+-siderophores transport system ATPase subunit
MDLPSRTSILHLIQHLHIHDKLTVIMVSHMLDDLANYVKRIALVERKSFQVGAVDEILTAQNLSALYEMSVTVTNLHGDKIILAGGVHGQR